MDENLPVPAEEAGPPAKPELDLEEQNMLNEIAAQGSIKKAADTLNIPQQRIRYRLRNNPTFREEYDKILHGVETLRSEFVLLSTEMPALYQEAMNANMTKTVWAQCPQCQHNFSISVTVSNWMARLKAMDAISKIISLLQDKRTVNINEKRTNTNVNVDIQMPTGVAIALDRLRRGEQIPAHVYAELEKFALQTGMELPPQGAIEGQFREVPNEDDSSAE